MSTYFHYYQISRKNITVSYILQKKQQSVYKQQ